MNKKIQIQKKIKKYLNKFQSFFVRERNDILYKNIENAIKGGDLLLPLDNLLILEETQTIDNIRKMGYEEDIEQLSEIVLGTVIKDIVVGKQTIHPNYQLGHLKNTLSKFLEKNNFALNGFYVDSIEDLKDSILKIMFKFKDKVVPVRIKTDGFDGGKGQIVLRNQQDLEYMLNSLVELNSKGKFIVEENIDNAISLSVGTNIWKFPYISIQKHKKVEKNIIKQPGSKLFSEITYLGSDLYLFPDSIDDLYKNMAKYSSNNLVPIQKDTIYNSLMILWKVYKYFLKTNISTGRLNIDLVAGYDTNNQFVVKILEFGSSIGAASICEVFSVMILQAINQKKFKINNKDVIHTEIKLTNNKNIKLEPNSFVFSKTTNSNHNNQELQTMRSILSYSP